MFYNNNIRKSIFKKLVFNSYNPNEIHYTHYPFMAGRLLGNFDLQVDVMISKSITIQTGNPPTSKPYSVVGLHPRWDL